MSIENFSGIYVPTCDACGNELEGEFEFYDAVEAKKSAGWKSVNQPWGWEDYCPECYQKQLWKE